VPEIETLKLFLEIFSDKKEYKKEVIVGIGALL